LELHGTAPSCSCWFFQSSNFQWQRRFVHYFLWETAPFQQVKSSAQQLELCWRIKKILCSLCVHGISNSSRNRRRSKTLRHLFPIFFFTIRPCVESKITRMFSRISCISPCVLSLHTAITLCLIVTGIWTDGH